VLVRTSDLRYVVDDVNVVIYRLMTLVSRWLER
jgi:hypothetical protein